VNGAGAVPRSANEAPHCPQNRAPGGAGVPHCGQMLANEAPQALQKRFSVGLSAAQAPQRIGSS
jgi:hypothetical protein